MTNREYLRKLNIITLERFEKYLEVENELLSSSFFVSKDLLELKPFCYSKWQTINAQYENFKTYLYNTNIDLDSLCDESLPNLKEWE